MPNGGIVGEPKPHCILSTKAEPRHYPYWTLEGVMSGQVGPSRSSQAGAVVGCPGSEAPYPCFAAHPGRTSVAMEKPLLQECVKAPWCSENTYPGHGESKDKIEMWSYLWELTNSWD